METIRFKTCGQRLSRIAPNGKPEAGSKGCLDASFDLDERWAGMKVAARFFDQNGHEYAAFLDGDSVCKVPDEVTDGRLFKVSLKGVGDGRTYNTNAVTVLQEVVC